MNTADPHRLDSTTIAIVVTAALSSIGLVLSLAAQTALTRHAPDTGDIFVRLFAQYEFWGSISSLAILAVVGLANWRVGSTSAERLPASEPSNSVGIIAGAVGTLCVLSALVLPMRVGFSMDEFNADFQAAILRDGHWSANVPNQWRGIVEAMTPIFVRWNSHSGSWATGYLPGYAVLRAMVGWTTTQSWLTNALLTAATVPFLEIAARGLGYGARERRWMLLLFVASPQVIAMGASAYSMPAHLLVNLAWLVCLQRRTMSYVVLGSCLGAVGLNLHNPFPHALFVAPFLIRALLNRDWRWLLPHCFGYAVGCALALAWFATRGSLDGTGGGAALFAFPGGEALLRTVMSAVMTVNWYSPLLAPLAIAALLRWRALSASERDLAAGIFLSVVLYACFDADQGHGWGYRYLYPVLGSIALLAGRALSSTWSAQRGISDRVMGAALLAGVVVQWPWRAWEIEKTVAPFDSALVAVQAIDADIVILPTRGTWYARDLIRNAPTLNNRPLLVAQERVDDKARQSLAALKRDGVRVIELAEADLDRFGLWADSNRDRPRAGGNH